MIAALLAVALTAQTPQAKVEGTVRDVGTGAPLAGARVALTDLDRAAVTAADGRYVLTDVPPGPQHVTVVRLGYAARTLHALVPPAGAVAIDVSLRREPIPLRGVEVHATVPVRGVEGDAAGVFTDRSVSAAALGHHPLLAEPDAFLALSGGEIVVAPESPSGLHVRGGAADQTAFVLDGVPVFSPYHAMGLFAAWNPDALARVDVASTAPSPALPDALSGVVSGVTRGAGARFGARGTLSTTQARVAVDGPVGAGGSYLVSARSGFPGAWPPEREASYLSGETGDLLAKVEAPAPGGVLRLLVYQAENEIGAIASAPAGEGAPAGAARHAFDWHSQALGAAWAGAAGDGVRVRIEAWRSTMGAGASWTPARAPLALAASRRDMGLLASVERHRERSETVVGLRLRDSRTRYDVDDGGGSDPVRASTPVAALFARHATTFGTDFAADVGASLAAGAGGVRVAPRAQVRWAVSPSASVLAAVARTHQYAQSVRNAESVAGAVFPADLYVGAGAAGVPVARADQGVVAAEWRPRPGVRLGAQAYARALDGVVLVAPFEDGPFAAGRFGAGTGRVHGAALDITASGARVAVLVAYGWQRVRLLHDRGGYSPAHGTAHLLDAGVLVHPSSTSSLRLSASGGAGRTATGLAGGFEWEACNLLDRGCEFAGSPRTDGAPGDVRPPAYLRIDAGARKHWHVRFAGRDAAIGLFATVTNILGRPNILTWSTDDATGERVALEMRPLAPLVAGLDWRF